MPSDLWIQPKTRKRKAERAAQLESDSLSAVPPVEIRSGAIIPYCRLENGTILYQIEANTTKGLRSFGKAQELLLPQPYALGDRWSRHHYPIVWNSSFLFTYPSVPTSPPDRDPDADTALSPAEVLAILTTADLSEVKRQQIILAAEVLRFEPLQAEKLKLLLRQFIDRHYANDQPENQVVVASAIRKYVALLNPTEVPTMADLLRADRKAPPPFEMEVAKMLTRKLAATLPEDTTPLKPLEDELIDLVRGYLNPRMLPKRYCGAVAFDSALALALARSSHLPELLARLRSIRVSWFRSSVARQARSLSSDLSNRFPAGRCYQACNALAELAAAAETSLP